MSEQFKYAPIVEAVFEARLPNSVQWAETFPNTFLDTLARELGFTTKETALLPMVMVKNAPEGGIAPEVKQVEQSRVYLEDRSLFVMVQVPNVSIHAVRPYCSWKNFFPQIEKVLAHLKPLLNSKPAERLGLRYVNVIEFDSPSIKFDEYFNFGVKVDSALSTSLIGFGANAVFQYQKGRDLCRVIMNPLQSINPMINKSAIGFDLDYFLAKPGEVSTEDWGRWAESAHDVVETLFLGSVTEKLKNIFRGNQ